MFCSDVAGEMYQTERLLGVVKQVELCMSAQEMIDLIMNDVTAFTGDVELSDDIAVVVMQCL